jgi:hypothetical protein
MSAVEVKPHVPDMGDLRIVPDPRPGIARCRLVVDRSAGTATWTPDRGRAMPVELRLGDGPGELAGIVWAIYPPAMPNALETVLGGQLLLVDGAGRVLARSTMVPQVLFEQMWPFDLLDATGLPVQEERFRNSRLAQKAHRGAAPHWPVTAGFGWLMLTTSTAIGLVAALVTLVVLLLG